MIVRVIVMIVLFVVVHNVAYYTVKYEKGKFFLKSF
jgi:hypothetical protein